MSATFNPNSLMTRIQARLDRLGRTAEDVSKKATGSRDTIRNIRRGKSINPGADTLKALAKELGCSVSYLLDSEFDEGEPNDEHLTADQPPTVVLEPPGYAPVQFITTRAGAGGGRIVQEDNLGPPKYFEETWISRELRSRPQDLRVIEIEGPSMAPELLHGDQVIFDTTKINVGEPDMFVLDDGEAIVCKWVERIYGSSPARLRLKSENPRFDPYEVLAASATIYGRVVWFARRR